MRNRKPDQKRYSKMGLLDYYYNARQIKRLGQWNLSTYVIDEHLVDLKEFSSICLLKFVLSEGEKVVISFLQARNAGGAEAAAMAVQAAELSLISNLISIVCRLLFQPLEDIGLNLFSQFKLEEARTGEEAFYEHLSQTEEEKESARRDATEKSTQVLDILAQYLAGVTGIGVAAVIFSQFCSLKFLLLVYSDKWATESAATFMKAYCVYLMFMALNGMSEAFAYGIANKEVLQKLKGLLFFNSVLYVLAVVVLTSSCGMIGLIYANCLNMAVRAFFSLKISLDKMSEVSNLPSGVLLRLFKNILLHKVFLGLTALAIVGTAIASPLLDYLTALVRKI